MAPHAEAAGQVQRLHGLRLHLAENRLADGLKLVVELVIDLGRAVGEAEPGQGMLRATSTTSLPQPAP